MAHRMKCEDTDGCCDACSGRCERTAVAVYYRVDMEDHSGTAFCEPCADDAAPSGLFTTERGK